MTHAKTRPHLSLLHHSPAARTSGERDVGEYAAGALSVTVNRASASGGLARSGDVVEVLTSLAQVLAGLGYAALIATAEGEGPPVEIRSVETSRTVAAWADMETVLESALPVQCDGTFVGVRFHSFHGSGDDGERGGDTQDRGTALPPFVGGLVARRRDGGAMGANDVHVIHALVEHAVQMIATERARVEFDARRRRVDELERALTADREIGVAAGILMAERRCSVDAAFELLRSRSTEEGLPLQGLAERVILTGRI